jgi:hypothetical protein
MPPFTRSVRRPASPRGFAAAVRVVALCLLALGVGACGLVQRTAPAPTPADFVGISGSLARHGITVEDVVSGDAGCPDVTLSKTAIRLRASGLDQATPVPVYLYIFGSRESYTKLRSAVDTCARSYAKSADTFASVEASPYVIAGQGPWGPKFTAALRQGLVDAAGTGN